MLRQIAIVIDDFFRVDRELLARFEETERFLELFFEAPVFSLMVSVGDTRDGWSVENGSPAS